ncbi:MAG: dihydroorotate dehydrogenase-like protein [Paludibacteraceae bacterium]|nr:dihydroorotate dehydrogenase-like protein [Paludibacteraceae bacterium]
MANLSVKYLGLDLKSPVIVGSCGLTNSIANLKKIEEAGAGAVVLKSIFEEQIQLESEARSHSDKDQMPSWNTAFDEIISKNPFAYEEALSYVLSYAKENTLNEYLAFVSEAKKALKIPVIASVNCISSFDWADFSKRIQQAGADAIELNIYILPSDFNKTTVEIEDVYGNIIREVKKFVSIPVSLKIGYYFSGLANSVKTISESGIEGLVLFNRPFTPDIDIEKISLTNTSILSNGDEYLTTLRWIAILSGKAGCDLVASTGIHNYETVVKQLLAGATAVEVASVLYKNGIDSISNLNEGLASWMDRQGFKTIAEFNGKLNKQNLGNLAAYERVQFMKNMSNIE